MRKPRPLYASSKASQYSSDLAAQASAEAYLLLFGQAPPPFNKEPSLYFLASRGVTLRRSGWIICPTFSARVIWLRILAIKVSISASFGTALAILGQSA